MSRIAGKARLSLAALLMAATACREQAPAEVADAAPAEPPFQGITLDLTPDPEHGEVRVDVRVSGDRAARVREVAVARAWADTNGARAILGPHARDAAGEIPLVPRADDGGPDDVFVLGRAPRGELALRYRAASSAGRSRFALRLAADRMSGVGHAFLLLPRLDEPAPARIRIHAERLPRGADAASSFGFGNDLATTATSEDLAHALYVAGMLWRERGPAGDELVVLGDPPFDTRTALDRTLAAKDAVDRFFGAPPSPALRLMLVGQPDAGPAREGAYLGRSIGLWFDARQRLDDELELVIAHELVHRYLGGAVRLVGADGREATWFAEGFAVHAARRALLDAGLLSPEGFATDVNRLVDASAGEALPDEYRRGALLAAWLDATSSRGTDERRTLDDALRRLVARGGNLPVAALRDALGPGVPADALAALARVEASADPPDLPADAFGPCLRRVARERDVFDVGFDRRSLDRAVVRGVVPGSAAARAGLRDGALVLRSSIPPEGDTRDEVELVLGDGKRIHYRPATTTRAVRWEPAPDARACLARRSRQSSR